MNIKIVELREGFTPVYKHQTDACADCFANIKEPLYIENGFTEKIPLGFAVEIPVEFEGVIKGRSGLTSKGVLCGLGTIDAGYTGEVNAIITNFSGVAFIVNPGDRICQFKVQKAEKIYFEKVDKLADSERGENGFGSSGVSK